MTDYIQDYIDNFELHVNEGNTLLKSKIRAQKKFVKEYPIEKITNLTLEEYVIGHKSEDSFCYKLEQKLSILGGMKGSFAPKFGIYFGKSGKDLEKKYRHAKKYGSTINEAFDNVKTEIISLIIAGENDDIRKIRNSKLANTVRYKILGTYYPNKFLNIYSKDHADYFISELGINNKSKEVIDQQLALLELKKYDLVMKKWHLLDYKEFLYYYFTPPSRNNDYINKSTKLVVRKIKPLPSLVSVKPEIIKLQFSTFTPEGDKRHNKSNRKTKIDFKKKHERNNRLGNRGEILVLNLEEHRAKNCGFDLQQIKRVSLKDDSLGYDIESLDSDGKPKFIEVKSTQRKTNDCQFFITQNELEKATKLKNYFLYIVFEVDTTKPKIWEIKDLFTNSNDSVKLRPISYLVNISVE